MYCTTNIKNCQYFLIFNFGEKNNERFYNYLRFYSLEDLYLKRSNNTPMAVLNYKL